MAKKKRDIKEFISNVLITIGLGFTFLGGYYDEPILSILGLILATIATWLIALLYKF